jgi:hypothetical protein
LRSCRRTVGCLWEVFEAVLDELGPSRTHTVEVDLSRGQGRGGGANGDDSARDVAELALDDVDGGVCVVVIDTDDPVVDEFRPL